MSAPCIFKSGSSCRCWMLESLFLSRVLKAASTSVSKLYSVRCCVPPAFRAAGTHRRGPWEDHCWDVIKEEKIWLFRSGIWTFEIILKRAGPAISQLGLDLNSGSPAKLGYVIPRLGLSKHGNHLELKSAKVSVKAVNKCSGQGELIFPPRSSGVLSAQPVSSTILPVPLQPGFGLLACGLDVRHIKQNTGTKPLCFLCKSRLCT